MKKISLKGLKTLGLLAISLLCAAQTSAMVWTEGDVNPAISTPVSTYSIEGASFFVGAYAGDGKLYVNNGGTLDGQGASSHKGLLGIATTSGFTATVSVDGGTITNFDYISGGAGTGYLNIHSGTVSTITLTSNFYGAGHMTLNMYGGVLTTSYLYSNNGSGGKGIFNFFGGTADLGFVMLRDGTTLNVSNKANVTTTDLYINGKINLILEGDTFDHTVLTTNTATFNQTIHSINMQGLTVERDITVNLLELTTGQWIFQDPQFIVEGLDESKYSVGSGAYWDGYILKIDISYNVPEPSAAAGLLGAATLAAVARRRRK